MRTHDEVLELFNCSVQTGLGTRYHLLGILDHSFLSKSAMSVCLSFASFMTQDKRWDSRHYGCRHHPPRSP